VKGAPPGDVLEVDPDRRTVVFSDAVTLPYEPFPGTIGVAPPEPGPHSIVPPRRWRGNMDDLKIHEVVDTPNWMVAAFIPDDIFTT
jgi:acetamidase/formamidase